MAWCRFVHQLIKATRENNPCQGEPPYRDLPAPLSFSSVLLDRGSQPAETRSIAQALMRHRPIRKCAISLAYSDLMPPTSPSGRPDTDDCQSHASLLSASIQSLHGLADTLRLTILE
jgi:hypothetical protein